MTPEELGFGKLVGAASNQQDTEHRFLIYRTYLPTKTELRSQNPLEEFRKELQQLHHTTEGQQTE